MLRRNSSFNKNHAIMQFDETILRKLTNGIIEAAI